jgi:hypothetical protein
MRQIELGEADWTEDGDGILNFVSEDGSQKWKYDDVEFADWKDSQAVMDGVCKVAQRHPKYEVVILFDGSDTMIFASMKDAINC